MRTSAVSQKNVEGATAALRTSLPFRRGFTNGSNRPKPDLADLRGGGPLGSHSGHCRTPRRTSRDRPFAVLSVLPDITGGSRTGPSRTPRRISQPCVGSPRDSGLFVEAKTPQNFGVRRDDANNRDSTQRFARPTRRDLDAVTGAVTEGWSNAARRGADQCLKTLKQAMYDRTGSELLRARMLPLHCQFTTEREANSVAVCRFANATGAQDE